VPLVRRHGVVPGGHGAGVRPPFEGSAILFRGCGVSAVREWAAQCHRANTGIAAQCRTMAAMASPGELAEQRRGMIPGRVRGAVWFRL
jgi:putative intracellular protease/amidase